MMRILPYVFPLFLTACAGISGPGPDRPARPALERGWGFVETEKEALRLDAGLPPVSYGGPVLANEKLVVGSGRFGLTVLAKRTGQELWRRKFADDVGVLPYVHESKVMVGTDSGEIYQFELDSGRELWKTVLTGPVHGSMVLAFNRLYVATADEALHALDPATGRVLWTYRRPAFSGTSVKGGGHPSIVGGKIWMGFSDGALISLVPESGALDSEKMFRDNLKFMDLDAKVIGWRDGLLVSTYDGKLRYLRRDGTLIWEFAAGGARAPILTEGETIYLPSSDGNVYALNGTSGKEQWRYSLRRGVPTGMAVLKSGGETRIVVAGSQEKLSVLDGSGRLLSESSFGRNSGSFGPIAVDESTNSFYVLSSYSRVYQFLLKL